MRAPEVVGTPNLQWLPAWLTVHQEVGDYIFFEGWYLCEQRATIQKTVLSIALVVKT
jgi:hypothetical protein